MSLAPKTTGFHANGLQLALRIELVPLVITGAALAQNGEIEQEILRLPTGGTRPKTQRPPHG
jgi:hypothetical protein